jgi:hypothetical protein
MASGTAGISEEPNFRGPPISAMTQSPDASFSSLLSTDSGYGIGLQAPVYCLSSLAGPSATLHVLCQHGHTVKPTFYRPKCLHAKVPELHGARTAWRMHRDPQDMNQVIYGRWTRVLFRRSYMWEYIQLFACMIVFDTQLAQKRCAPS